MSRGWRVVLLLSAIALVGCDPIRIMAPAGGIQLDPDNAAGEVQIVLAQQDAAWEAESNQPWFILDRIRGNGSGSLSFSVDTSHGALRPPGTYTATVTVTSGGETATFQVMFVVTDPCADSGSVPLGEAGPVSTDYLPLQVGNYWELIPAQLESDGKAEDAESFSIRFEVTDALTRNGFEVAEVDVTIPILFGAEPIGDSISAALDVLPAQTFLALPGEAKGMPEFGEVVIYIVNAGGEYYFTSNIENLDSLPCSVGFAPLSTVLEFPGRIFYGIEGGVFADFQARAELELYALSQDFLDLDPELAQYFASSLFPGTLIDLADAFNSEFRDYERTTSPLVNALAQLIAVGAGGVRDTIVLIDDFTFIAAGVLQDIYGLTEEVDFYVSSPESAGPAIELLRSYADDVAKFTSPDPVVQGAVEFSEILARGVADIIESIVLQEEYALADADVADLVAAIEDCFRAELFSDSAGALDFFDGFIECVTNLQTSGAGSAEFKRIVLEVLSVLRDTAESAIEFESTALPLEPGGLGDLDEVDRFTEYLVDYFDAASAGNPDDVLAEYLGLIARLLDESVNALLNYRPSVSDLLEAAAELRESVSFGGTLGHAGDFAQMFEDFNAFLLEYDSEHSDALAEALGFATASIAEILDDLDHVLNDLDDVEFVVQDGPLSDFVPVELLDGQTLSLASFYMGEQNDVRATLVTIDGDSGTRQVPTSILANGVGPIFFGGAFTLCSWSVDGEVFECLPVVK